MCRLAMRLACDSMLPYNSQRSHHLLRMQELPLFAVAKAARACAATFFVAPVYRWAAQDGAVRAYIGFSYIKYSRTSFIPFYYITEVLNLRSHPGRPSWAAQWPKRPNRGVVVIATSWGSLPRAHLPTQRRYAHAGESFPLLRWWLTHTHAVEAWSRG
jgi:hypothetical protein